MTNTGSRGYFVDVVFQAKGNILVPRGKYEQVMVDDQQSSLEDLLVDEEQLNEELLFGILSDYIRIGNESGSLVPQPAFEELTAKQQITVVLLAQKARFELDRAETEWLTPTEISEESGIKSGTVFPAVRDLEDDDIVVSDDGEYRIPPYNFTRAEEFIKE